PLRLHVSGHRVEPPFQCHPALRLGEPGVRAVDVPVDRLPEPIRQRRHDLGPDPPDSGCGARHAPNVPGPSVTACVRSPSPCSSCSGRGARAGGVVTGDVAVRFVPDADTDRLVFRLWPNAPRMGRAASRLDVTAAQLGGQPVAGRYEAGGALAGKPGTIWVLPGAFPAGQPV